MIFRTPPSRPVLAIIAFGAALAAGSALGAEADNSTRIERLGQGIQNIGRHLDVTQLFNRPPEPDDIAPNASNEASATSVRLDRLESQLRSLNGLVEQLQHDVRRLEEQLRRTSDAAGAPAQTPQRGPAAAPDPALAGAGVGVGSNANGLRRGDAFDPGRDSNAPGSPRPLGTTVPSAPLAVGPTHPAGASAPPAPAVSDLRSPGAPLDLTHGRLTDVPPAPEVPAPPPQVAGVAAIPTAPQTPRDEFDLAVAHLRQGEYEAAEKGFSGFLAKNSRSKLAPQATFDLGESFFLRERHREAAEKFLEISTKYPTSPQAPEAMLRLGQSLHAIGAKEQACASFSEIAVKYPSAPARVKEAAQRESKKVQC